jgi:hypothetical protein
VTGGECHLPGATATRSDQINTDQYSSVLNFQLDYQTYFALIIVSAITSVSACQRKMTEVDPSEIPLDIDTLKTFTFTRILSQGEWATC